MTNDQRFTTKWRFYLEILPVNNALNSVNYSEEEEAILSARLSRSLSLSVFVARVLFEGIV